MNIRVLLFSLTLTLLLMSGYSKTSAQPISGDWTVTTDFGQFVFTVNSAGTHITKVVITFSSFNCGGVIQGGSVSTSTSPGWPITNNQFSIQVTIDPLGTRVMTINGSFTQTGEMGSGTWSENVSGTICSGTFGSVSSVEEICNYIPDNFSLEQNYPNPFNPSTTIQFAIPKSTHVELKIYNAAGIEVATLVNSHLSPGEYRTSWNAGNAASGIYLYRIVTSDFSKTKKMILLK